MTRRRVKTGLFTEFPGPVGWLKNLGWEDAFRQIHDRCDPRKKRVSWHLWTTFSYIGYMYIGMPWRILMRLGMPLAFIGCRTNGPSDYWEDPVHYYLILSYNELNFEHQFYDTYIPGLLWDISFMIMSSSTSTYLLGYSI